MPTFSGPTNIPPWEAFRMKIPVFYSDIHNIKKVYKDAVYYIDPMNPRSMVRGIQNLLVDKGLRKQLVDNGDKLLDSIEVEKEFQKFFQIIKKKKNNKTNLGI